MMLDRDPNEMLQLLRSRWRQLAARSYRASDLFKEMPEVRGRRYQADGRFGEVIAEAMLRPARNKHKITRFADHPS